jgi:2-polyprenyl-3-methyl-5-hydroxy-6-metoxy-1,4-benzoquinol methylase
MPTSDPRLITPVAQKILELQPKTVLDIGVGFGKWGALAREYTDIWGWRFYKEEWLTRITGIEAFEKYASPSWGNYDRVYIGKAEDLLPQWDATFDLIIMMEVLEHIEKLTAHELLNHIFSVTNHAIISFSNIPQSNVRDNPLEDHVSTWTEQEIVPEGFWSEVLYKDPGCSVLFIHRS